MRDRETDILILVMIQTFNINIEIFMDMNTIMKTSFNINIRNDRRIDTNFDISVYMNILLYMNRKIKRKRNMNIKINIKIHINQYIGCDANATTNGRCRCYEYGRRYGNGNGRTVPFTRNAELDEQQSYS